MIITACQGLTANTDSAVLKQGPMHAELVRTAFERRLGVLLMPVVVVFRLESNSMKLPPTRSFFSPITLRFVRWLGTADPNLMTRELKNHCEYGCGPHRRLDQDYATRQSWKRLGQRPEKGR
jgi:hypothetical protein